ncbi:MAG TPA: PH domain-containing protein [Acidimicrobiales bacterium]|nr:PH domain-containing protein [Acidimicrobiales bacterium]
MAPREDLLGPDEQVLLDARPHPKMLFGPALISLIGLIAAVFVRDVGRPDRIPMLLSLALGILGALWLAVRWLQWTTSRLTVTTDRVMTRHGVVAKKHWQVTLERVHDISCSQTILERLLGAGDLAIETGGDRGHLIEDVARPFRVQHEIYGAMENSTVTAATRAMDRRDLTIPEQIEKLDELRQRGVISQAEFDVKKTQLLDRL